MQKVTRQGGFDLRKDIFAVVFFALGVFFGLCLISYSPSDPALNSVSSIVHVRNLGGLVGAYLADILFIVFGVSAYLTSLIFIMMSVLEFRGKPIRLKARQVVYFCLTIAFAAALIHLRFESVTIKSHGISGGGIIGGLLGDTLARYLNRPGAYVTTAAGFFLFLILATRLSVASVLAGTKCVALWLGRQLSSLTACFVKTGALSFKKGFAFAKAKAPIVFARLVSLPKLKRGKVPEVYLDARTGKKTASTKAVTGAAAVEPIEPLQKIATALQTKTAAETPPTAVENVDSGPRILKRADAKLKRATDEQLRFQKMAEGYEPPPVSLLDAEERRAAEVDESTLKKNSLLLEKKLRDFEVEGKVTAIHPGPVITMYEFEPATGTKINRIVNLQDDLSLTLGGRSVRIIPHLPGRAAVGVEVPNNEREIVWLKNIISSSQYVKASTKLPLALGSSTSGLPTIIDLTKMPHILIAGATGSGKSVAINSIILSLIYKSSPSDVRFILVDPKMLELSIYDGIPHLLLPVVTKAKPAVRAMRWAIAEMERRYKLLASVGARNISSYNEKIKAGLVELASAEEAEAMKEANPDAVLHAGAIPYIIIVIDEMADLMMTTSQDMEETVTRLAQMARAAGIHLVLATQRPSVDVITGLIKANFPARIAFKVTAKHDSRTILDGIGAERLLGNGDMLFMTPQGGNLIRVHGSYVSDADITRVVNHLKLQGEPVYDESITAEPENEGVAGEMDEIDDELYDQALRIVAETKQASISMVQRRLRIGYNRAARLIEKMEAEGVVGPADGSKPRQVLVGNQA